MASAVRVIADTQQFVKNYANPFYRVAVTFPEMFPVAILVSLISAALLRNSRLLPARGPS